MNVLDLLKRKEDRLEYLQNWLVQLKTDFKKAETPGVRQLIHEDIVQALNSIETVEASIESLKRIIK